MLESKVVKGPVEWSMEAATQHVLATVPRWLKPSEVTEPGLYMLIDTEDPTTPEAVDLGADLTLWRYNRVGTHVHISDVHHAFRFFGPIPECKEG